MNTEKESESESEWFEDWFNSPYYHILYRNRDQREADLFIDSLINTIPILPNSKILDLACGRGRHSHYLNKKGFNVLGVDLSERNITYAKRFENNTLSFQVHDMRDHLPETQPDYVLNLFTSFGYFANEEQNIKVLENVHRVLNNSGKFIIDYLNVTKAMLSLGQEDHLTLDNIHFNIQRKIENNFIIKEIHINDDNKIASFQEMVKILYLADFEDYFTQVGFTIDRIFGDYHMNPFDESNSDRLIFIVKKMR